MNRKALAGGALVIVSGMAVVLLLALIAIELGMPQKLAIGSANYTALGLFVLAWKYGESAYEFAAKMFGGETSPLSVRRHTNRLQRRSERVAFLIMIVAATGIVIGIIGYCLLEPLQGHLGGFLKYDLPKIFFVESWRTPDWHHYFTRIGAIVFVVAAGCAFAHDYTVAPVRSAFKWLTSWIRDGR